MKQAPLFPSSRLRAVNITTMKPYNGPAQIQADARTSPDAYQQNSFPDRSVQTGFWHHRSFPIPCRYQSHTGAPSYPAFSMRKHDFAAIRRIFKGIRQQIGYRLIQLVAVYPCIHRRLWHLQLDINTTQVGIVSEERNQSLRKLHQVGFPAREGSSDACPGVSCRESDSPG